MASIGPEGLTVLFLAFWGLIVCGILIFFRKLFEISRSLRDIAEILKQYRGDTDSSQKQFRLDDFKE
jgi:hypothetical protein